MYILYIVDLTMKRPDDAVTRPTTPLPPSNSQEQLLEEMHTPYSLTRNGLQQEGSGELDLLSEANHTHFLLDSFYSSHLYRTIENRVGRSDSANDRTYSVWVDAPGQEESNFSIYRFYHEVVSRVFEKLGYIFFC